MFIYKSNQPFLSYIAGSLDISLHLFIFRLVFLHGGGGEGTEKGEGKETNRHLSRWKNVEMSEVMQERVHRVKCQLHRCPQIPAGGKEQENF